MVDDHEVCGLCGKALPCGCVDLAHATERFRLLPNEGAATAVEERFTGLLREVKGEVLERPFLADEGRPLLDRVRRMGRLIDEGDLRGADVLAQQCMTRVVAFPVRPRTHRRWWVIAIVGSAVALGIYAATR